MFGRKIKLKWLGEEYTLNTTFEMAEEIDEQVNILKTSIDIDSGGVPKVTTVAKLYSVLLSHAGKDVSAAAIYESIMADPADSVTLIQAARAALYNLFPEGEKAERTAKEPSENAKKN